MTLHKYLNNLYRVVLVGFILFSFNRCGKQGDEGETLSQEHELTSDNTILVTNSQDQAQSDSNTNSNPKPKIDVVELLSEVKDWGVEKSNKEALDGIYAKLSECPNEDIDKNLKDEFCLLKKSIDSQISFLKGKDKFVQARQKFESIKLTYENKGKEVYAPLIGQYETTLGSIREVKNSLRFLDKDINNINELESDLEQQQLILEDEIEQLEIKNIRENIEKMGLVFSKIDIQKLGVGGYGAFYKVGTTDGKEVGIKINGSHTSKNFDKCVKGNYEKISSHIERMKKEGKVLPQNVEFVLPIYLDEMSKLGDELVNTTAKSMLFPVIDGKSIWDAGKKFTENEFKAMCIDILRAYKQIGFKHNDLSFSNILQSKDGVYHIIDCDDCSGHGDISTFYNDVRRCFEMRYLKTDKNPSKISKDDLKENFAFEILLESLPSAEVADFFKNRNNIEKMVYNYFGNDIRRFCSSSNFKDYVDFAKLVSSNSDVIRGVINGEEESKKKLYELIISELGKNRFVGGAYEIDPVIIESMKAVIYQNGLKNNLDALKSCDRVFEILKTQTISTNKDSSWNASIEKFLRFYTKIEKENKTDIEIISAKLKSIACYENKEMKNSISEYIDELIEDMIEDMKE